MGIVKIVCDIVCFMVIGMGLFLAIRSMIRERKNGSCCHNCSNCCMRESCQKKENFQ